MSECNCLAKRHIPGENTPTTSFHLWDCPALKKYLFYYVDAVDAWVPCPEKAENIVNDFAFDEEIAIRFKWVRMSETEFKNLPQD